MSIQEKNDSEKAKAITDNSNQEELEDKYDLLMGKKDSEFEEDYLTFDQNKETQKNNPNQENNEEKNNALAQKDKANKDNSNQEEIENCIEDRVKKNNEFYKEVYTYNQEKEVKGKNAEENKSEISEAKSTGEDSMIVEETPILAETPGYDDEVIERNEESVQTIKNEESSIENPPASMFDASILEDRDKDVMILKVVL